MTRHRSPGYCGLRTVNYNWAMKIELTGTSKWLPAVLAAALLFPGAVAADDTAGEKDAECMKVARAGSRIPVRVCGDERDIRSEVHYPLPGVTPADRVSRLDEQFPWLNIENGNAAGGPR